MSEARKKQLVFYAMIGAIVIAAGLFIKFVIIGDNGSKNNKIEIQDVEVSYQLTDDKNCYLIIRNPNNFPVNVSGYIVKYDENMVEVSSAEDSIDILLFANQSYIAESKNPNNSVAIQNNEKINFEEKLEVTQSKVTENLAENIDIKLELDKQNDMGRSLIIYKNNNDKLVSFTGYIVFYEDSSLEKISYLSEFEIEDLKANEEYRDYILAVKSLSSDLNYNYKIYINSVN